jgi:hypothetical protein
MPLMTQRQIQITFLRDGAYAIADLLEGAAPNTVEAIVAALPFGGFAHHAVYSGSEGVLILPELLKVGAENATADVTVGDIGFTWFDTASSDAVTDPFAEICWFYGEDAQPSMPEGPVPVSLFARIRQECGFAAASKRLSIEGREIITVELVPGPDAPITHVRHRPIHLEPHNRAYGPRLGTSGGAVYATFSEAPCHSDPTLTDSRTIHRAVSLQDDGWALDALPGAFGEVTGASFDGVSVSVSACPQGVEANIDGNTELLRYLPCSDVGVPAVMHLGEGRFMAVYHAAATAGTSAPSDEISIQSTTFRIRQEAL